LLDTLNREAVKSFYEEITKHPLNDIDSREDILTSNALSETGITCSDTRDERGAFRYLPDNPITDYRDPSGYSQRGGHKWAGDINAKALNGFDAFSDETVAIHLNYKIGTKWLHRLVNYTEEVMYRYHDFLSGRCDEELLSHSPNATKIKWLTYSQQSKHRPHRAGTKMTEHVLGMPPGYLRDLKNL
jgi:hypothetical protein